MGVEKKDQPKEIHRTIPTNNSIIGPNTLTTWLRSVTFPYLFMHAHFANFMHLFLFNPFLLYCYDEKENEFRLQSTRLTVRLHKNFRKYVAKNEKKTKL